MVLGPIYIFCDWAIAARTSFSQTKSAIVMGDSEAGAVTGEPEVMRQDQHGHAWALALSPDGNVWGATVNRTAGDPDKLDDVVFPLFPQGGFPRSDADLT